MILRCSSIACNLLPNLSIIQRDGESARRILLEVADFSRKPLRRLCWHTAAQFFPAQLLGDRGRRRRRRSHAGRQGLRRRGQATRRCAQGPRGCTMRQTVVAREPLHRARKCQAVHQLCPDIAGLRLACGRRRQHENGRQDCVSLPSHDDSPVSGGLKPQSLQHSAPDLQAGHNSSLSKLFLGGPQPSLTAIILNIKL